MKYSKVRHLHLAVRAGKVSIVRTDTGTCNRSLHLAVYT